MLQNLTFTRLKCYIMFFIHHNMCYLHYSNFGFYNTHNTPRLRPKSLEIFLLYASVLYLNILVIPVDGFS